MQEISNRINEKLISIGEDPAKTKPFLLEHLTNIENYLINLEKTFNEALEIIKLKDFSISNIANELNMSRTTFYNHNQLLSRYLDVSEKLITKDNPLIQLEAKTSKIRRLKAEIDMLYDRDITIEIQKHEVKELTERLKEKNSEINRIEKRNKELSSELHNLRKSLKNITSNAEPIKLKK
jgi:DNA repair exonuclease SbcCD ATPase subunit